MNLVLTILIASAITAVFFVFQFKYFSETKNSIKLFDRFFKREGAYSTYSTVINDELIPQISNVGEKNSDLSTLIYEINNYIKKTRGTSDFSIIQNKVERKLKMRYDQSTSRLSFPTYIGLMGTFLGVFFGIFMFVLGFDDAGNVSDDSIKNLLIGVMVSMFTSLVGLGLTTYNNKLCGDAKKKIEEEKNIFYDFIQTELMPSIDVSLVTAITRLHSTVDKFEPAFNNVINRFQKTFDRCTKAFGEDFEKHVNSISTAVAVMGENMDKINENIRLQENLISAVRSDEISKGLDKFVKASVHFNLVTNAIASFEDTRNRLLEAVNYTIENQNRFNESLDVPRQIALALNRVLSRLSTFEENINRVGKELDNENLVGNKYLEVLERQITEIQRKGAIANRYFETADGKLEDMFNEQTNTINSLTNRYAQAVTSHIKGFEDMLKNQMSQIEQHHNEFVDALKAKFDMEEVRQEFTNLKTLTEIEKKISEIVQTAVQTSDIENLKKEIIAVSTKLEVMKLQLQAINSNTQKSKEGKDSGKIFGFRFG